jgi:hypothetical protein
MRDEFDHLQWLKNKGYVVPFLWKLNPEHKLTEIIADLSATSGKTISASQFGRLLQAHNIY